MKKRVFLCLLVAVTFGITSLSGNSIDDLNRLTPEECMKYTLANKDGLITMAVYKQNHWNIKVFGKNGELLNSDDFKDCVYEIGSLTKTITAALICKAQNEGLLKIEDSIDMYLKVDKRDRAKYYPTISSLLTHTSGYKSHYLQKGMSLNHLNGRNDFYGITREQILEQVKKVNIKKEPKYEFVYSNFGYAVLGLILESVYHQSYTEIVNKFVQNDLGMKNTRIADGKGNMKNYWLWNKDDGYLSAGALYSTIGDMIIYANLQLEEKGIFAECHKMMAQAKTSSPMYTRMGINMDQVGYAWIFDNKNNFIWHNGATGNFNCYLGFKPRDKKAAIVLSNLPPDYKIPATVVGSKLMK